ncbi:MAG: type II toxin-antitoxin system RatA family toxin [Cytophagales bacterium]|nr:type II toxin-antitoxin system RatA family toxin [Cytophagales bacterium]
MKSLHKSVLIWYSPKQMFDVVTDVARYHEFLPWCHESSVLERTEHGMKARIGMQLVGFKQGFTTHNLHIEKSDGGLAVQMDLVDGPFSKLGGTWSFEPIAGSESSACKIKLDLAYEIKSALLQMAIGGAFDKIANSLVDAFAARAKKIYA